ncbi:MAG: sarcosine oxidase subunit delta [Roseicyclus sp.]
MQIDCPVCGARDIREFSYKGHATYLERPSDEDWSEAWDDYLYNRENPAGETRDLWHHGSGCGAWLAVTRNTVTHEILSAALAREVVHAR